MSYPPNNNQGMQANYTGMQQGPGQGYVQSPNDIRAQNQGSYPSGMQGTGSYGPAGGGAPQGYGGGQGVGPQGVGPQGVVGSSQGYGQGVGAGQGYSQGGGGGFDSGTNTVAGPQYCLPQVSAYAVSKKVVSMSGGDWKITDATGRIVFKVSGRVASVRDKRFLRDPSNKTVLRMQKKVSQCPFFPKFSLNCFLSSFAFFLLHTHRLLGSVCLWLIKFVGCVFFWELQIVTMHDTWQIYSAADTLLATVKKSSLVQFKTAMDVFLASSSSSKNADYVMQGDFLDRNLTIFQGAQQAALVCSLSILPKNQIISSSCCSYQKTNSVCVCASLSLSYPKQTISLLLFQCLCPHLLLNILAC